MARAQAHDPMLVGSLWRAGPTPDRIRERWAHVGARGAVGPSVRDGGPSPAPRARPGVGARARPGRGSPRGRAHAPRHRHDDRSADLATAVLDGGPARRPAQPPGGPVGRGGREPGAVAPRHDHRPGRRRARVRARERRALLPQPTALRPPALTSTRRPGGAPGAGDPAGRRTTRRSAPPTGSWPPRSSSDSPPPSTCSPGSRRCDPCAGPARSSAPWATSPAARTRSPRSTYAACVVGSA
jgi:hypothetical protein